MYLAEVEKVETEAGIEPHCLGVASTYCNQSWQEGRLAYGVQFGAGQFISKSVNHHLRSAAVTTLRHAPHVTLGPVNCVCPFL